MFLFLLQIIMNSLLKTFGHVSVNVSAQWSAKLLPKTRFEELGSMRLALLFSLEKTEKD